jgi:hypothetical protein
MEHAKQYFHQHNSVERLYFTSDNLAFFDEQNALNHARHLEDGTITSMTREEVEKETASIIGGNPDEELDELLDELAGNNE